MMTSTVFDVTLLFVLVLLLFVAVVLLVVEVVPFTNCWVVSLTMLPAGMLMHVEFSRRKTGFGSAHC